MPYGDPGGELLSILVALWHHDSCLHCFVAPLLLLAPMLCMLGQVGGKASAGLTDMQHESSLKSFACLPVIS